MEAVTVGSNIQAVTPIGKILSVFEAVFGMLMIPMFTVYVTNIVGTFQKVTTDVSGEAYVKQLESTPSQSVSNQKTDDKHKDDKADKDKANSEPTKDKKRQWRTNAKKLSSLLYRKASLKVKGNYLGNTKRI